jgi:hypothetical protein
LLLLPLLPELREEPEPLSCNVLPPPVRLAFELFLLGRRLWPEFLSGPELCEEADPLSLNVLTGGRLSLEPPELDRW